MDMTTIRVHSDTKAQLDKFKDSKNESYDDVIKKIIHIIKRIKIGSKLNKESLLSEEASHAIEKARKRIKAGRFVSEKEAKKRLGF